MSTRLTKEDGALSIEEYKIFIEEFSKYPPLKEHPFEISRGFVYFVDKKLLKNKNFYPPLKSTSQKKKEIGMELFSVYFHFLPCIESTMRVVIMNAEKGVLLHFYGDNETIFTRQPKNKKEMKRVIDHYNKYCTRLHEQLERFPDDECQITEREADPLPLSLDLNSAFKLWIEESFN